MATSQAGPGDAMVKNPRALRIVDLLRPHWKAMTLALASVGGGAAADLLNPWPIKMVLDYVLESKPMPGWLSGSRTARCSSRTACQTECCQPPV